VIGAVLFLIGLILYRHEFPAGVTFGILLAIIAFGVNGFYGFFFNSFLYQNDYSLFPSQTDGIMSVSLILMFVQALIFAIFAFVWSLSKSDSENGKKVDDQISIEKGSAFESYVDKDKKVKDVKTTKKSDVEFKF
jgi:predicted permease